MQNYKKYKLLIINALGFIIIFTSGLLVISNAVPKSKPKVNINAAIGLFGFLGFALWLITSLWINYLGGRNNKNFEFASKLLIICGFLFYVFLFYFLSNSDIIHPYSVDF